MQRINNVVVIGAGSMGHGIAQVAATAGQEVKLVDISAEILEHATDKILWSLDKLGEKAVIKKSPQDIIRLITCVTELSQAVRIRLSHHEIGRHKSKEHGSF